MVHVSTHLLKDVGMLYDFAVIFKDAVILFVCVEWYMGTRVSLVHASGRRTDFPKHYEMMVPCCLCEIMQT
jgi:hypothetical protein